jgi:ADP-heptose:LPS heptosyltransferase
MSPAAPPIEELHPHRIHLYRPHNQLGDLLLNVPAIRAVRGRWPAAHVTLIVGRQNAAAVLGQPWADEIRVVETRNFFGVVRASLVLGPEPDLAIYFTTVSYSRSGAFLARRSGAAERIGFDPTHYGERDRVGLTRAVPYPGARIHQSELSLALAGAAGAAGAVPPPPYYVPSPELCSRAPEGVAYLHPGAGKIKNRWSAEGFAAVAREFLDRGLPVCLVDGPQDAGTVEAVWASLGREIPASRGEAIPVLAARFARAAIYVGSDTGLLHLAGAVGCPTVGIYGPTDPAEWSPVGARVRSVRAADASLASVTPSDVLSVALPFLEEARCVRL